MKIFFSFSLIILFFLGCSTDDNFLTPLESANYRKIAYESLTPASKETLIKCWCVAPVKTGVYKFENDNHFIIIDEQNKWIFSLTELNSSLTANQRLVAVIFNTNTDALLGPLTAIIDQNSEKVIGYNLRF